MCLAAGHWHGGRAGHRSHHLWHHQRCQHQHHHDLAGACMGRATRTCRRGVASGSQCTHHDASLRPSPHMHVACRRQCMWLRVCMTQLAFPHPPPQKNTHLPHPATWCTTHACRPAASSPSASRCAPRMRRLLRSGYAPSELPACHAAWHPRPHPHPHRQPWLHAAHARGEAAHSA